MLGARAEVVRVTECRFITCCIGALICGACCTGGCVSIIEVVNVNPDASWLPIFKILYCLFLVFTRIYPGWFVGMPCPGLRHCNICSVTYMGPMPGWLMTMFLPARVFIWVSVRATDGLFISCFIWARICGACCTDGLEALCKV